MSSEQVLRVARDSDPNKVAGALIRFYEEGATIVLTALGVDAVNQLVKSVIRARSILQARGLDLHVVPSYRQENVDGRILNAVAFHALIPEIR